MPENTLESSKISEKLQKMAPNGMHDSEQMHEMSLFDLAYILWEKKYWIVALTCIITITAFFYALSLTHIYRAEAVLLPPSNGDIGVLNVYTGEHKDEKFSQDKIMGAVISNYLSRRNRWQFFNIHSLSALYKGDREEEISEQELFKKSFDSSMGLEEPDKKSGKRVVFFESADAQLAAKMLNDYLGYIREQTKINIIKDIISLVETRRNKISIEIEGLRKYAEYAIKDKIKLIKEQLSIARKLNIHENKLVKSGLPSGAYLGRIQSLNLDKQTASTPIQDPSYLEGTKALQTALEILSKRKSNDSHVIGLRELQSKLQVLEKAKVDKDLFRVFIIEQMVLPPKFPIKPRKKLIVILAFIAGALISVFIVVMWHFAEYLNAYQKRNI